MTDSRRVRPILATDQDVAFAVSRMREIVQDQPTLYRVLVENFTVDLDMLAEAVRRLADEGSRDVGLTRPG